MSPMASRMWAAVSDAANKPAMAIPAAMAGIMIFRFQALRFRRYVHTVSASCASTVGRMMAAACSGGT